MENKIEKIKEILETPEVEAINGFRVGEKVFIRTLTYHYTGRVAAIDDRFVTLVDAAWIADSGRFMQAIEEGKLNEVEPVTCPIRIGYQNLIDVFEWRHDLPREQK